MACSLSKWFFPAVLLLFSVFTTYGQSDTLVLNNGQVYAARKLNYSSAFRKLKVNMEHTSADRTVEIPLEDIASIRFADGFELPFSQGKPVRSGLLSAPHFTSASSSIYAQGMIPLSQEEIRTLYGETLYRYGYRTFRRVQWAGLAKAGVGIAGWAVSHSLNPSEWVNIRVDDHNHAISSLSGTDVTKGDLYPDWLAAGAFFTGLAVAGFTDCWMSSNLQQRMLGHYLAGDPFPSRREITVRYVGGAALMAAGLGTMAGCYDHLNRHRTWLWEGRENLGKEGETPVSKMVWIYMAGGAFLTHFGVSMIEVGALESRLRKHSADRPMALHCSFGVAPSGYGLTLQF